jgi:peroxiredoxin
MPALQVASESFPDGQFIVLAVNAGEAPNKVTAFMAEEGLTFPALMDRDGKIVSLYGVNVFPTTVWVDAEGIVQAQHFGPLTSQQIDDYVTTLIDGS